MAAATETIAAVATAPGRGAVGMLRLSGPRAWAIAQAMTGGQALPAVRNAALRHFHEADGRILDQGLLLLFAAPHSFTGEDVAELQGHGGPVVLDGLLRSALAHGARAAQPGEFSQRAFLHDRLDLAQAEAIADLIDAGSLAAARAAMRSLDGEFSQRVDGVVDALIGLRADLEAALDFADEDLPWLSPQSLAQRLQDLADDLSNLLNQAGRGRRLRDGLVVAIAGRPNVGKSTLMNRLAGAEVAIVSDIAGTTRDTLRETIDLDGVPVNLIDTAGLRDTDDPIEREGVKRARAALQQAELVLLIVDDREVTPPAIEHQDDWPQQTRVLVVRNKCDLSGHAPGAELAPDGQESLRICAASGAGLDTLRAALRTAGGGGGSDTGVFSARSRHLDALQQALVAVRHAQLHGVQTELIAEDLRLAQQALEAITGRYTPDDLLDRIFSSFCIGK